MIGKNGANIKKIRDSTGARIVFPSSADEDREVVTIIGKKESVDNAKEQLEAMIKEIVSFCFLLLFICYVFFCQKFKT